MGSDNKNPSQLGNPSLPKFEWKKATCVVCGESFDYLSKRRPATCRSGECRYRYHYKIDREQWADYQPSLFDSSPS